RPHAHLVEPLQEEVDRGNGHQERRTPPIRKPLQATITSDGATSSSFTAEASTIIGIASRKENRDAVSRVMPRNRPAVMVTPERDVPGTRARAWAMPTRTASFQLSVSRVRWRLGIQSATPSNRP